MNHYKFSDLSIGLAHSFQVVITEAMMNDFLKLSGDNNPMHVDELYAVKKGFSGRLVYGMLTSVFYSQLAGVHLPGEHCILHGINISFSKPVYIGDELKVSGNIKYLNDAFKVIEIDALITNQNNVKVSKATIKAGLNE